MPEPLQVLKALCSAAGKREVNRTKRFCKDCDLEGCEECILFKRPSLTGRSGPSIMTAANLPQSKVEASEAPKSKTENLICHSFCLCFGFLLPSATSSLEPGFFARNWSLTVCFRTFWFLGHDLFLSNLITICGDRASRDVIFFDENDKFDDLRWLCCYRPYMWPYMSSPFFKSNLITLSGDGASRDVKVWDPNSNLMTLCGEYVVSNPKNINPKPKNNGSKP